MITELKSVRDIWKKMPSEHHRRVFLREMLWSTGHYCPHGGCVLSVALGCQSARAGAVSMLREGVSASVHRYNENANAFDQTGSSGLNRCDIPCADIQQGDIVCRFGADLGREPKRPSVS